MKVCVIFERSVDGGWAAYAPGLPGIGVVGRSVEQVRDRVTRAIEMHIADMGKRQLVEHDTPGEFAELLEVGPAISENAHAEFLERSRTGT